MPFEPLILMPSSHQIGVAAEAMAAAQFARCGFHVSVQYGANQPDYDLIVEKNESTMKVSVKGSQDGAWPLAVSYVSKGTANYHNAVDQWLARNGTRTVMCLVQFYQTIYNEMPRMYLATPNEIADCMRVCRNGIGDAVLWEDQKWIRGKAKGTRDRLPEEWKFSPKRADELLIRTNAATRSAGLRTK